MAQVTVQVIGGAAKVMNKSTIQEIKSALGVRNHQATVNGEPANDNYELQDYEFVSLAPSVKGA